MDVYLELFSDKLEDYLKLDQYYGIDLILDEQKYFYTQTTFFSLLVCVLTQFPM